LAHTSPDKLWTEAQQGKKLTPRERRAVIAHLESEGEFINNYELAGIFGVDEKAIRRDRKRVLTDYANAINPDVAMEFVAKYLKDHDLLIANARRGMAQAAPGGITHIKYLALLSDLSSSRIKLLQDIGVVQKELGHLNVSEEVWEATVSDEGITGVQKGISTE
jgi:hypothetical protein